MKKPIKEIVLFLIAVAPIIATAILWNKLPENPAIHYNINNEPDNWTNKMGFATFITILSLFSYGLLQVLPLIDPKKYFNNDSSKFYQLKFIIVANISLLFIVIIFRTIDNNISPIYIFGILGLFLISLGNHLRNIKPNYFIGIRTPWTLENKEVWKQTHRIGSISFMLVGVLIILITLLLPLKPAIIVNLSVLLLNTAFVVGYSFYLSKKFNAPDPQSN